MNPEELSAWKNRSIGTPKKAKPAESAEPESVRKSRAETAETAKKPQKLREKTCKPAKSAVIETLKKAVSAKPRNVKPAESAASFKDRLKGIGMTQTEFSRLTMTPLRTVESWKAISPPENMLVFLWLLETVPGLVEVLENRE